MARRVPAADSTEGLVVSGRSSFPDEDTAPPAPHFLSDGQNDDFSVSSDYFSDFLDIDPVIDLLSGIRNDDGGNDNDGGDLARLSPLRPTDSASHRQPSVLSASQLPSTASRTHPPSNSQRNRPRSNEQDRSQPSSRAGTLLPPLAPQPLNRTDSAINIDDDDDDDDLEFLFQNDFSSPSIPNDDIPIRGTPSRIFDRITLSPDAEAMPQTRRRAAEARAAAVAELYPLPLPAAPVATSTATPTRIRTRANSNSRATPRVNSARPSRPPGPTAATTPSNASHSGTSMTRSSTKRLRNGDPVAGSSGTALPPIATLLASVGGSSSSNTPDSQHVDSQASSSSSGSSNNNSQSNRPRISLKRPRREEPIVLDDDLFGSEDDGDGGVETVNLVDVDRPRVAKVEEGEEEETSQQDESATDGANEKSTLVRLSAQQCVICMDDMTYLTVTHCGHLFCGECLYSSLTTDSARRICPICRTKIEMRGPTMSATKLARSYFPLQLKMRSRNQQGKQVS